MNPNDLIDRADLTDPVGYVHDIYKISNARLNDLRTLKGQADLGIEWKERSLSFKALDFPEALDIPTVINMIMLEFRSQYRYLIQNQTSANANAITMVGRDLLMRGFTHKELDYFREIATTIDAQSSGLHPTVGERFREKSLQEGLDLSTLRESIDTENPNMQVIETYYKIYLTHYHNIKNEVYGEFLSKFSLGSRRVILAYSYEHCLNGLSLGRPIMEPTLQNWKQVYLPSYTDQGEQQ